MVRAGDSEQRVIRKRIGFLPLSISLLVKIKINQIEDTSLYSVFYGEYDGIFIFPF
jgi:hypothetical protein